MLNKVFKVFKVFEAFPGYQGFTDFISFKVFHGFSRFSKFLLADITEKMGKRKTYLETSAFGGVVVVVGRGMAYQSLTCIIQWGSGDKLIEGYIPTITYLDMVLGEASKVLNITNIGNDHKFYKYSSQ